MWEKKILWKLVGLSRMLPVTFQHNATRINRCKKKVFFLQITTFTLKLQVRHVHAEKNWNFSIFRTCEKKINNNWGVGRGRLYLVSSVVWAKELIYVRICFFHKTAKWPLFALINEHIWFRLKSWLSSLLPAPENRPLPREIDSRWLMMMPTGVWACLRE